MLLVKTQTPCWPGMASLCHFIVLLDHRDRGSCLSSLSQVFKVKVGLVMVVLPVGGQLL